MHHIFYFFGIFPILFAIIELTSPKKSFHFFKNLKKIQHKPLDEFSKKQYSYSICMVGYMLWLILGLFTFQWPLFILMNIIAYIQIRSFKLFFCNIIITLFLLVFTILNAYQFKIDLWQQIINFF
jgi:hypothetical protein